MININDAMRSTLGSVEGFLRSWRNVSYVKLEPANPIGWRYIVPLLFFAIFFLHLHGTMPNVPSGEGLSGWEGWWDQGNYVKSANALARGNLDPAQHWYSIGYSAMAVPFVWLGMREPFLVVNLVCLLAFAGLFIRYFERIIGFYPAVIVLAFGLLLPLDWQTPHHTNMPMLLQFVIPWNNTPIPGLYMGILLLCGTLAPRDHPWRDVLLGALVGVVVSIKFSDALPLIIPGAIYAWQRIWIERNWRMPAYAFGGLLLLLVPFLIVTFSIHGGIASDYLRAAGEIGLSFSDFHERVFQVFLGARAVYDEAGTSIFALQPWLYFAAPFALVWLLLDWRSGLLGMGLAVASLSVYIAFNDFWTFNIFRFYLIHYIVWILPFLAAGGIAGFLTLWRMGAYWGIGGALAVGLLLSCINTAPSILPADVQIATGAVDTQQVKYQIDLSKRGEIDAIDFFGANSPDATGLTQVRIDISADGGEPLRFYHDYRIIQVGHGVRLIFRSHIKAKHLSINLGPEILNLPAAGTDVVSMKFKVVPINFVSERDLANPKTLEN